MALQAVLWLQALSNLLNFRLSDLKRQSASQYLSNRLQKSTLSLRGYGESSFVQPLDKLLHLLFVLVRKELRDGCGVEAFQ